MNLVIIDLQQIMIANLMVHLGKGVPQLDEKVLREMVLRHLLAFRKKYKKEYQEFVIAGESKPSWRKEAFPYYKFRRKKAREELGIDWEFVIQTFNKLTDELYEYFPYRVVRVPNAEADDVIGVLASRFGKDPLDWFAPDHKVLIISRDTDFLQLQRWPNIQQWDPIGRKDVKTDEPARYLFEHICAGDSGDDIPNILSADDCFVTKTRQKPCRQVALDAWWRYVSADGNAGDEKYVEIFQQNQHNFDRNCKLIDLSCTPKAIKELINKSFDDQQGKDKKKLMNYMIHNGLSSLMESLDDF
jgi:hypothetical protein